MQNLLGTLIYTLRQFRLSPVFTTAATLTLALGIGGTTAISALGVRHWKLLLDTRRGRLGRPSLYAGGRPSFCHTRCRDESSLVADRLEPIRVWLARPLSSKDIP